LNNTIRILLIDDNPDDRILVIRELEREFPGLRVEQVIDTPGFQGALEAGDFDLAITDYQLHWTDGLAVLRDVKERWPECPVIMFTATGTEEVAVEAMKIGLNDYILKSPKHYARLSAAVRLVLTAVEERRDRREAESRYQDLYKNAPVAYLSIGVDGDILDCNSAAEAYFGYSLEELQKMKVIDLCGEEFKPKARQVFEALKKDIPVENEEMVYRKKDGDNAYGLLSVSAMKDRGGNIVSSRSVIVDITERKRAEEKLRESEERLRTIAKASGDYIMMLDMDYRIQFINSTEQGVDPDLVIGTRLYELVDPEDQARVRAHLEQVIQDASRQEYETVYHRPDGTDVFYSSVAMPVIIQDRVVGVVVNSRDITDRKRATEALNLEREQLLSIFESINEIIYVADPDTYEILFVNKTLRDAFGKDLKGGICYREFQGFDEPCDFCTNNIILKNKGQPYRWEYHNPILDRDHMITDKIIQWTDGRDVRFELAMDITERKKAEERVKRLNHLFLGLGVDLIGNMETIVETSRDILSGELANYCRMERGRLLTALSTAPGEVLNLVERPEDLVCYEVISRSKGEPLVIEDLEATGFSETDPYVIKYGLKSFLGYPVILKRKTIGCLSLYDTRRREFASEEIELMGTLARALAIEEERLAREEDMKDFIDIASHELRHPVTLMKGYAVSLRDLWERLDEEQMKEMLAAIDHGSERLNRLVLGLLDLSRIERGRFGMDKQETELKPLIEQAIGELQRGGLRNQFELSIPDKMNTLKIDSERITELLLILLENAVKFSPPEVPIDIEVVPQDKEVLVSVLDRGLGVPEDYRELVFERFAQVEDALHHSIFGMGMGLYIAKEIVEAHGGRIWCDSREGGGSAFRFTLPL